MTSQRGKKRENDESTLKHRLTGGASKLWSSLDEYFDDETFDRRLDQSVDFLRAHGFGGEQLQHLFRLDSRRQKFIYIASVTSFTLAVTIFSRSLVGRSLKRIPFLSWGWLKSKGGPMPKKSTLRKSRADRARGKKPSTQAGHFVKEEIDEIREGRHGAANTKQAIAIGLAKARRAGVAVGESPTRRKKTAGAKKKSKKKTSSSSRSAAKTSRAKRSRAATRALEKKPKVAASPRALARHARAVARRRK